MARAADITYMGNGAGLQLIPAGIEVSGGALSLFPGTTAEFLSSDNTVTIDYVATNAGVINPHHVFGGLGGLEDAVNNEVKLIDGYVSGIVFGGYADYSSNANYNTVIVSGGKVSDGVYGGYSYRIGNAEYNSVTISGGEVSDGVYGGYSDRRGNAEYNTVTISNGEIGGLVYGGYSYRNGNANYNTVIISGGNVRSYVYGGFGEYGGAEYNTVIMSGGEVRYNIYGGDGEHGNAAYNMVTISNGDIGGNVYGGMSYMGNSAYNAVTISSGNIGGNVYGGESYMGNSAYNAVTISSGNIGGNVYGGESSYGDAAYNTATISGGVVARSVYGGYSDNGIAEYNAITISGGEILSDIFGGLSYYGDTFKNTVTINSGVVTGYVYGGHSRNGYAEDNAVAISGGEVDGIVYGGWSNQAYTRVGSIKNNAVTISGGSVVQQVYGGYSSSTNVAYNTVTISGGFIGGDVFGGYSWGDAVEYNTVTISGGSVGENIYGGRTDDGINAINNTVTISGGSIGENIYGGYSWEGNVEYNAVTISGGSVGENVYGGFLEHAGYVTNNTITISGNPLFSTNTFIYGGYTADVTGIGGGDVVTGNKLNVKNSDITTGGVGNFEYYNFYLPQGTAANDTMLFVTESVDLAGTTAEVFMQAATTLQAGDEVTLINSIGGVSNSPDNTTSLAMLGAFIIYDFDIYTDSNNLWARLSSTRTAAENKVLTNSRAAPLAFLNQGADMAASLEHLEVSSDKCLTAFAVVTGGSSTYNTGSDIDIDGFSLLAGVTWNAPVKKNSLALSAFIEAGWGSYDTYNDFGGNIVRGDGDTDYYGGGLHMRYGWGSDTPGGLYAEGSLRYGRVTTDFNTKDLQSEPAFHYDSGSNYYGVHVGLGYVWQLSGKTRLDVSGKYLWTHLESEELTASNGDEIRFDAANSHRLRAGFRFYHDYGNTGAVTLYYGAAYEYEFDGDAAGRLYGTYALDGSSLAGGSGIGELGVMFRPSKDNDRLTMQLGLQGYVGVREGISGTLKLQYTF